METFGEAEVNKLYMQICIQRKIFHLKISVNDRPVVQELKSEGDLYRIQTSDLLAEVSVLAEQRKQVPNSINIGHYSKEFTACLPARKEFSDEVVLSQKTLDGNLVLYLLLGTCLQYLRFCLNFDRDLLRRRPIKCPIDGCKPSLSKNIQNLKKRVYPGKERTSTTKSLSQTSVVQGNSGSKLLYAQ